MDWLDSIKSRIARVVRDGSGRPRRFDGQLVDDAARLVAEVERLRAAKRGRWEQVGDTGWIACSECGGLAMYGYMGEVQILTGHCPDCGCEMEGEKDG